MHYQKIFSIGDPLLSNLFDGEVFVEEKVDGSQFRVIINAQGTARYGSKTVDYSDERAPDKMFVAAIAQAEKHLSGLDLKNAFLVFEYLEKPQQNSLSYGRVPKDNLVLLDAMVENKWLKPEEKKALADKVGFECIPLIFKGTISSVKDVESLLEKESFLGNAKIEGIVVKNYGQYHKAPFMLGAPVFGKYVREEFKELNRETWGVGKSLEEKIMEHFPLEPRWQKVVQHARESGELKNGVKDIGKLIQLVEEDFSQEAQPLVKELLWKEFSHALKSMSRRGFPEWFKKKLLEESMPVNAGSQDAQKKKAKGKDNNTSNTPNVESKPPQKKQNKNARNNKNQPATSNYLNKTTKKLTRTALKEKKT